MKLRLRYVRRVIFLNPLGVAIPKDDGTQRLLGIPSVVDRLLQQAAHQVISLKFEPEFKDHSYGFRPGRNAHQAVAASAEEYS